MLDVTISIVAVFAWTAGAFASARAETNNVYDDHAVRRRRR